MNRGPRFRKDARAFAPAARANPGPAIGTGL